MNSTFEEFAGRYDFGLDGFQREACARLDEGASVLVAAPTGAGKTVVGEYAVHLALGTGRKCFYTTPIKALSNQKYAELVDRHGTDRVGLLTGDNTVNGEAPIVVMTTEVLRNMIYAGSRTLDGLGYVVMDEVHYLADRDRGAVWEEVIIHLAESVALVCLSATVSNAEEFGDWLQTVRGDTTTIIEEKRPVPLHQHVLVGRRMYDLFADRDTRDPDARRTVNPQLLRVARDDRVSGRLRDRRSPRRKGRNQQGARRQVGNGRRVWIPSRREVVDRLEGAGLLPAIVFIFSRAGCDAAVRQCLEANVRLTTSEQRDEIVAFVDERCGDIPDADLAAIGYRTFLDALSRGVAAHHAGMLPTFKECVEELFLRGLCRVVFATETLALGINMPARSVVIERLSKWNGETHANLTPGEYTQLTGRAGRRGLDVEGHGVVLWQPGLDPASVAGLASRRTYPLRSSFRPSYNMAVNLVRRFGRERARELLECSFAQFQADRAVVGFARQLRKSDDALAGYAEAAACDRGEFMEYAALRRRLSETESTRQKDRRVQRRVAELRAALRTHPCHECPDREDHARWAERWFKLDRDARTLRRRIERRQHTLAREFDRICQVLLALGHLEGEPDHETVTERGRALARIHNELDLVTAEALWTGQWDHLDPSELAAVLSALVFEARRPDDARPPRVPGGAVRAALDELTRLWGELDALERDHKVSQLREPDAGFCHVTWRWAEGDDLEDLLRSADLGAGDFVRWMKQVIDLAGQVADAAGDSPVRENARESIRRLRRGVVAWTSVDG